MQYIIITLTIYTSIENLIHMAYLLRLGKYRLYVTECCILYKGLTLTASNGGGSVPWTGAGNLQFKAWNSGKTGLRINKIV